MTALTFPTGKSHHGVAPPPGRPDRATHCICHGGPSVLPGQEACWRCGRHPKDVVAETWGDRARAVARRRAKAAG